MQYFHWKYSLRLYIDGRQNKKKISLWKKAVIFWMVHQVTTLQFTLLCTKFFVKTEAQRWSKITNIYSLRWTSFQYNFFDSLSKFEAKRKKKSKETKIEVSSLCAHTQIHTLARTHARAQENSPTSKSLSHTSTYAHTHTHMSTLTHTLLKCCSAPTSLLHFEKLKSKTFTVKCDQGDT